VREYYEERWSTLPAELDAPLLEQRRRFLLAHARSGQRALDLGCGDGRFTAILSEAGADAVGVDVADGALERARERHPAAEYLLAAPDGTLPLEDASVDLVWASEVIEHVGDTARWLSEVRRVLRSGGTLLLTTPDHGVLRRMRLAFVGWDAHFDPVGEHLRFYTRRSLVALLEDFGFAVDQVRRRRGTLMVAARREGLASRRA
jgi:ubiquinone/menaquinone biosynthesis C-methylase UbiE